MTLYYQIGVGLTTMAAALGIIYLVTRMVIWLVKWEPNFPHDSRWNNRKQIVDFIFSFTCLMSTFVVGVMMFYA